MKMEYVYLVNAYVWMASLVTLVKHNLVLTIALEMEYVLQMVSVNVKKALQVN